MFFIVCEFIVFCLFFWVRRVCVWKVWVGWVCYWWFLSCEGWCFCFMMCLVMGVCWFCCGCCLFGFGALMWFFAWLFVAMFGCFFCICCGWYLVVFFFPHVDCCIVWLVVLWLWGYVVVVLWLLCLCFVLFLCRCCFLFVWFVSVLCCLCFSMYF